MMVIKLVLQYDGTDYSGWQVQKREKTIQSVLESAIRTITGEQVRVTGAGRTDAGVHALRQVAAFRTRPHLKANVLFRALKANLPSDIYVVRATECDSDFHPRFDAKRKTYSYIISSTGLFSVFLKRYSWQIPYEMNISSMRKAAKLLVGQHDFSCFRASGCSSKSAVRTIKGISISRTDAFGFIGFQFRAPLIKISIQADAFLRHMARNIVGTLVEVGRGKVPAQEMKRIMESKDRKCAGQTAPAQGLFMEKIVY
ncbi:MAG: tRNA pseudouridine(38-40) synthase TruA [Nitrospiraceae bacterium]|nr:MAG: tRNA pseudouridine(38-40) synthase TruA [Nitrospiraceae bacterium]